MGNRWLYLIVRKVFLAKRITWKWSRRLLRFLTCCLEAGIHLGAIKDVYRSDNLWPILGGNLLWHYLEIILSRFCGLANILMSTLPFVSLGTKSFILLLYRLDYFLTLIIARRSVVLGLLILMGFCLIGNLLLILANDCSRWFPAHCFIEVLITDIFSWPGVHVLIFINTINQFLWFDQSRCHLIKCGHTHNSIHLHIYFHLVFAWTWSLSRSLMGLEAFDCFHCRHVKLFRRWSTVETLECIMEALASLVSQLVLYHNFLLQRILCVQQFVS